MSIPDRFYRIARHKLGEIKDWFDKVDEEDGDNEQSTRRDPRADAKRELSDALSSKNSVATPSSQPAPRPTGGIPVNAPINQNRTAPYMAGGGSRLVPPQPPASSTASTSQASTPDPLAYHYRLLSLEPGADFGAVQEAYNRLSARCDPSRFPAGSAEERQAQQIRERLETSYKQLRDVLDTTATRFDRLEF